MAKLARIATRKLAILFWALFVGFVAIQTVHSSETGTIQLASVLPKLQAIHEDAKSLLIKNVELKNKILLGLQAQNEAKIKQIKESKLIDVVSSQNIASSKQTMPTTDKTSLAAKFNNSQAQFLEGGNKNNATIDYTELEEFNKWVETNLEYAVKNTQASAEALKEEAQLNNGTVDYTEQAIKDGIEGVKYWQSAVIFQDKTLKNEKYDPPE